MSARDGPHDVITALDRQRGGQRAVVRVLVVLTVALGVNYVAWRWTSSVSWSVWWIAVPLVLAETCSLVGAVLTGITMWRMRERGEPAAPDPRATVDVFVTTCDEDVDLVMTTARAAQDIRFPHYTWILDDGARDAMRDAAVAAGVGYITRSAEWADMPRHARAGNLNNALMHTDGEFLLVLAADQIPEPTILDRTLGYFRDRQVAVVQTPRFFTDVTDSDPLGSQAPLFSGPIQQGKDGWDAAYFCGSNAVLRRDALMQLGIVGHVRAVEQVIPKILRTAESIIARAERAATEGEHGPAVVRALWLVRAAVRRARRDLAAEEPVSEVGSEFRRRVEDASGGLVSVDVAALNGDTSPLFDDGALQRLAARDLSPLDALASVRTLVDALDVERPDEAQPVMPMTTMSVTEDMDTAMRLHAMGWKSVYHPENLAYGLAPEDLGTMLQQRLRWARGTLHVMLRENTLRQEGLSAGQRLMYVATMWSYLSGFAALAYIAAPVLFLIFGVQPLNGYGADFLWHLLPYLLVNQVLFVVIGHGTRTWRGTPSSLALFPLWIRATWSAVADVMFTRSPGVIVTPETRVDSGPPWRLIWPQLLAMGLLVLAVINGTLRYLTGLEPSLMSTVVNVFWALLDLVVLSVIIPTAPHPRSEVPAEATVS